LNGFDDVLTARATADIAGNAEADLLFGRVPILLQEPVDSGDHAGRAETAL
jgi:hypothetical protein